MHGTIIRLALERFYAICSSPSNFFSGGRTVVANRLTTHILQVRVQFIDKESTRGTQRRRQGNRLSAARLCRLLHSLDQRFARRQLGRHSYQHPTQLSKQSTLYRTPILVSTILNCAPAQFPFIASTSEPFRKKIKLLR